MEQLRIGMPPRDAGNPISRLLFGLAAMVIGVSLLAVVLFVILPLVGIIVSASVGGIILRRFAPNRLDAESGRPHAPGRAP